MLLGKKIAGLGAMLISPSQGLQQYFKRWCDITTI
jgi:hypothetical protein